MTSLPLAYFSGRHVASGLSEHELSKPQLSSQAASQVRCTGLLQGNPFIYGWPWYWQVFSTSAL